MTLTVKAVDLQIPDSTSFRKGHKGHVHVNNGMQWKINLPGMLLEVLDNNPGMGILYRPFQIMFGLFAKLAGRALELNDPELNGIMMSLNLYELEEAADGD